MSYSGFTSREKVALGLLAPEVASINAMVATEGLNSFDRFDNLDLRDFMRQRGVPESVVTSNFFRQFYDAPFNEPFPLSATVGLKCLHQIFNRPGHFFFNGASRDCLIAPLEREFTQNCGGIIEHRVKVHGLRLKENSSLAAGVEISRHGSGEREFLAADFLVMAVGCEDFKAIDFGPRFMEMGFFKDVQKLECVSSIALQAWFRDDPVPPGIDSLVNGLPEPLSILAPLGRVRRVPPPDLPLQHEISACGPEAGFEEVPDLELARRLFTTLNECGFKIPIEAMGDKTRMHVNVRRNRHPAHRYLLTRPGQLQLRPTVASPIPNMFVAGSWIRNRLPLPCAESAVESGLNAARMVAQVIDCWQGDTMLLVRPQERPPFASLCPPPFHFGDSEGAIMLFKADAKQLSRCLPPELQLAPGLPARLIVAALQHRQVRAARDKTQAVHSYEEVVLAAIVRPRDRTLGIDVGIFPFVIYVNDDMALMAGREIYGFPKRMSEVHCDERGFRVMRRGRVPGAKDPADRPLIQVLDGCWSMNTPKPKSNGLGQTVASGLMRFAKAALGHDWAQPDFYNILELPVSDTNTAAERELKWLTRVSAKKVEVSEVKPLREARVILGESLSDPVQKLAPNDTNTLATRLGFYCKFKFTLGEPELRD